MAADLYMMKQRVLSLSFISVIMCFVGGGTREDP